MSIGITQLSRIKHQGSRIRWSFLKRFRLQEKVLSAPTLGSVKQKPQCIREDITKWKERKKNWKGKRRWIKQNPPKDPLLQAGNECMRHEKANPFNYVKTLESTIPRVSRFWRKTRILRAKDATEATLGTASQGSLKQKSARSSLVQILTPPWFRGFFM